MTWIRYSVKVSFLEPPHTVVDFLLCRQMPHLLTCIWQWSKLTSGLFFLFKKKGFMVSLAKDSVQTTENFETQIHQSAESKFTLSLMYDFQHKPSPMNFVILLSFVLQKHIPPPPQVPFNILPFWKKQMLVFHKDKREDCSSRKRHQRREMRSQPSLLTVESLVCEIRKQSVTGRA